MNYPSPVITERTRQLPVYLCTAGENHKQEAQERPNGAKFHHLFFVLEGELLLKAAEKEAVYPSGTALFLPKDTPMFYSAANGRVITGWLTFDGYCVEKILNFYGIDGIRAVASEALIPQYEMCVNAVRKGKSHEKLSALLYSILIAFFSLTTLSPKHLKQACDFIRENAAQDLSVLEIADAVGISPSLLYRIFKQEHMTPISYLHTCRIEMAKRRLLSGSDTVAQIGCDCGFNDRAYFCKIFRRLVGMSPNEFRKLYR